MVVGEDRVTSKTDLKILLNDLKEGTFTRDEAVVHANELAEAVVGFIAERTGGLDPSAEAFDEVGDAASVAQQGYEWVGGLVDNGTPMRDTLMQLSGYWEMRAASAHLEASVMRNRSATAAPVTAPTTSTSDLSVPSTKAAGPTTSVDVAEVKPKLDLGQAPRDRRPEARSGDVRTRPSTGDGLGAAAQNKRQFNQDVEGIARRRGHRGFGEASTSSKGTDPTAPDLEPIETPGKEGA
jgi:hypothetical protein